MQSSTLSPEFSLNPRLEGAFGRCIQTVQGGHSAIGSETHHLVYIYYISPWRFHLQVPLNAERKLGNYTALACLKRKRKSALYCKGIRTQVIERMNSVVSRNAAVSYAHRSTDSSRMTRHHFHKNQPNSAIILPKRCIYSICHCWRLRHHSYEESIAKKKGIKKMGQSCEATTLRSSVGKG